MKILPFESTSTVDEGLTRLAPESAITSTESPYEYTFTFSPMFNLYELSNLPVVPAPTLPAVNKSYPTCNKALPDAVVSLSLNNCSTGLSSTVGVVCSTDS